MIRTLRLWNLHGGHTWYQAGVAKGLARQLHCSSRTWQANGEKGKTDGEVNKKYYYEIPGNKLNPHSYFYRVLAVPYMKFCGVIIATYYGMSGLWEYLDSLGREQSDSSNM